MRIDADLLMGTVLPERQVSYGDREAILYALSVGAGSSGDLRLVHEDGLIVLPSFGQNLAFDDSWMEGVGIDLSKVVHGGLDLRFHVPLPAAATVTVRPSIAGLGDKGEGKAATLLQKTDILLGERVYFTSYSNLFIRGAGGFGGDRGMQAEFIRTPDEAPQKTVEVETRPDQALLFRLLGDRNPLHAVPEVARAAGFERPILHGAATFGIACQTLLSHFGADDPAGMTRLTARFSGPLYPGETLVFSFWERRGEVFFTAGSKERSAPVLSGGKAELRH